MTNDSNVQSSSEDSPPSKKISRDEGTPQKSKEYIPARRSGAYGLLMALLAHTDSDGHLTKKELLELAQPFADVSFVQTDVLNAQYYNAWSSMSTLISKGLVGKKGNPAKYHLTYSGRVLAKRLDQAELELHISSVTSTPGSKDNVRAPLSVHADETTKITKSPAKRVAKGAAVRTELPDQLFLAKPRTHIESRTPTKSNGILQPADIIFIDDDEFDIYPQRTISLNSNGQSAVQKPIEVAVPSVPIHRVVERIAEEETDSYSHARDMVTLKAGEYEIILCVDCAEVSGY